MDKAQISIKPPHPLLAPFVQYVTTYLSTSQAPTEWPYHLYKQIPNGNARILFRVNYPDLSPERRGGWKPYELVVMGPMKVIQDVPGQGSEFIVMTVRAGGLKALLGVPALELADQILPLEHFWGDEAVDLLERLVLAPRLEERLRLLQEGLVERVLAHPPRDFFVLEAARLIEAQGGPATLAPFFRRTGYSIRQVERKFNEALGFGPKEFARVTRFKRLFGDINLSGNQDWTCLALDYGFFDKAHLFHDFRKLLGQSPSRFLEDYQKQGIPMPGTPQREVILYSNKPPENWFHFQEWNRFKPRRQPSSPASRPFQKKGNFPSF